jgi:F0F1-type ATP synthase beta subunit
MSAPHGGNVGTVTSVHGGVVDAAFGERLPAMNALLRAGDDDKIALEVATQLSAIEAFGIDGAASVVLAALDARGLTAAD